ncbi:hypothetical protein JX266_000413 [Neoarthrinium moseri]|nr:hypothetical protein JX266_000413 [Neoarthrinium moseri]
MDNSQELNWTLINEMAAALTQQERDDAEWRIRNTGKLPMAIGLLFGLAALAFFGRIVIRIWSRRRIFLDDGILTLSFVCLVAATAIFYRRARVIYMVFALLRGDAVASLIASQEIADVFDQMNWSFSYITFLWTAIFMVKLCYFAFFHTLIRSMPKALTRYYWISFSITTTAWVYLVLQQLVVCPYFGSNSFKCFPTLPISNTVLNFTTWTGPVLDSLTDIAIVSIPILVLRKSQMALLNKIGLGVFLCLSLFMLACSITRAAGTYYNNTLDTPWQVFWLHAEACVAVLMASVTVYRSVLVNSSKMSSSLQRFVDKVLRIRSSNEGMEPEKLTKRARFGLFLLSPVPNATLTGLATLFAETRRTPATNINIQTVESAFEMRDIDYHDHLKPSRSTESPSATHENIGSREVELWRAPKSWVKKDPDTEVEQRRPPGRVAAFFLRFLLPPSHRLILQHRSIGTGSTRAGEP